MSIPDWTQAFTIVQSNLADVDIKVKLDPADRATTVETNASGWNNQLVQHLLPTQGMDPSQVLVDRLSNTATMYTPESVLIPSDYQDKFSKACSEYDPAKRAVAFQELMKIIIDQYCLTCPIYEDGWIAVNPPEVHDLELYKFSNKCFHWEKTWLSK